MLRKPDPLGRQPTRTTSHSMDSWDKQCNQSSRVSSQWYNIYYKTKQCPVPRTRAWRQRGHSSIWQLWRIPSLLGTFWESWQRLSLLTMRRSWGVICKYAAVNEHSGLACRTWVWFCKYKQGCVDTSWPPESSMHLARGTYWLSEHGF